MDARSHLKELMQALATIPQLHPLDFKPKYRQGVNYVQGRFALLQQRILYNDALNLALRPSDPFDRHDWNGFDVERQTLELKGDLLWAQMQVINQGFDLIRDAAIREGHAFPFNNPRSLCAAILQQQRDYELEPVFATGSSSEGSLSSDRKMGAIQSKLYRNRLSQEEEAKYLDQMKEELWSGFWLYAIWDYRLKGGAYSKLRESFKTFLKAHKAYLAFCNSPKVAGVAWTNGIAIDAKNRHPLTPEIALLRDVTAS